MCFLPLVEIKLTFNYRKKEAQGWNSTSPVRNNLSPVTETGPLALPLEGRGHSIAQAAGLFTTTNATHPDPAGALLTANTRGPPAGRRSTLSRQQDPYVTVHSGSQPRHAENPDTSLSAARVRIPRGAIAPPTSGALPSPRSHTLPAARWCATPAAWHRAALPCESASSANSQKPQRQRGAAPTSAAPATHPGDDVSAAATSFESDRNIDKALDSHE